MLLDSFKAKQKAKWHHTRFLAYSMYKSSVDWGKQPFNKLKLEDLMVLEDDEQQKEVKPDAERAIAAFNKYKKLKEDGGTNKVYI